jgi:UDP-N-acetylmuramoylalanine--D-glutamate ligase
MQRRQVVNVVIFGLGNHGGGAEAAAYFARLGCRVTVTDRSDPSNLSESIRSLSAYPVTYEFGRHTPQTLREADLIIKNPAVSPDHPLLQENTAVHSDFSYTLPYFNLPLIAITGTKGKSTTADATAAVLKRAGFNPIQAGNMGISPFRVLSELQRGKVPEGSLLVGEFSSWQLRDIARYSPPENRYFTLGALTSLFPDHADSYRTFRDYREDKLHLFRFLKPASPKVIASEALPRLGNAAESLRKESFLFTCRPIGTHPQNSAFTAVITAPDGRSAVLAVPRPELSAAAAVCFALNVSESIIEQTLAGYRGLPHRRETVGYRMCGASSVRYVNDSAATVPEAVLLAVESCSGSPVHLITGGTDKKLDLAPLLEACRKAASVHLLAGSLTERLFPLLEHRLLCSGPHRDMESAFAAAERAAEDTCRTGFSSTVLLSPGAASFELFSNADERGRRFCEAAANCGVRNPDEEQENGEL